MLKTRRILVGPGGQPTFANSVVADVFLYLMLREGKITVERSDTLLFRWLVPAAQDIALHALVCLLRAAEIDVCGHREADNGDTGGRVLDVDTAGGGRAVLMEEGVLLLILRACAMFQDHHGVVKACCMLMRVGVQCSLSGEGPKVRNGCSTVFQDYASQRPQYPPVPLFSIALVLLSSIIGRDADAFSTTAAALSVKITI